MSTGTSPRARSHEENWLPVLELAVEEVFEIMVGQKVTPAQKSEAHRPGGFTAMVGLAGGLCGILTISCDRTAAQAVAKSMLGPEITESEEQISDALGEICNMVAGNFESGSSQMKSASQATFDRIAALLRLHRCNIRVEGHTDNVPIHNSQFSSNWELSASRATEIVRLLIVRDGYLPGRLSAAGYAEFHPVASNDTAGGRGLNRRVDIVVLREEAAPILSAPPVGASPVRAKNAPAQLPKSTAMTGPQPGTSRVAPAQ
jgi:outer membrane protein OmpA-like peptidoglycan-associated protein